MQGIQKLPAAGNAAIELNGADTVSACPEGEAGQLTVRIFIFQIKHLLLGTGAEDLDNGVLVFCNYMPDKAPVIFLSFPFATGQYKRLHAEIIIFTGIRELNHQLAPQGEKEKSGTTAV